MSETLRRIQTLVTARDVHVSEHGYEELQRDAILLEDLIPGITTAVLVEEYLDRFRGPSILSLQHDGWKGPCNSRDLGASCERAPSSGARYRLPPRPEPLG